MTRAEEKKLYQTQVDRLSREFQVLQRRAQVESDDLARLEYFVQAASWLAQAYPREFDFEEFRVSCGARGWSKGEYVPTTDTNRRVGGY